MRVSGWLCLAQQTLCSLTVLCALGRLCSLPRPPMGRLLSAALLGGLMGVVGLMTTALLRTGLMLTALLLPCAVWPGLGSARLVRLMFPQWLLMGLLDGIAAMAMQWLPLLWALPAGCILLCLLPRWHMGKPLPPTAALRIFLGDRCASVTALCDSGNLLRDPVTGLPVIVLGRHTLRMLGLSAEPAAWQPGMRYLPFRTAAGQASMLILRAEGIELKTAAGMRSVEALLGIPPIPCGDFAALVPAALLHHETREEVRL